MKFSITGQEKCDLLIQVTTQAGFLKVTKTFKKHVIKIPHGNWTERDIKGVIYKDL
jgi:hypothetical protein